MTPDRVSVSPSGVPPLPPRGVPRHWYFCLPGCLSPLPGYLCPLSGSAPRRHREPLPSRFPPRGSFPRVPPSFCCGASGFVRSACGRGAVLPVPRLRPCGDLETFPLAGAARHPRGPRETGGSWVSAEPAGSVGHVRSFVLCSISFVNSLPLAQRGPAETSPGNVLSRVSLPSACVRAREGK